MTDIGKDLRNAYEEGFEDGAKALAEKIKHRMLYWIYDFEYSGECIAAEREVDDILQELNLERQCGYKPITELKNKCGTCVYGIPSTFGKSNCYIECTNQEHIAKYCKRPISRIRQRTAPACRSYEDKTEKGGDNDA